MSAVTAKVVGVKAVWMAIPRPTTAQLAAASVANVDGVLTAGGAHAIAALAFGVGPVPQCDVVVGPGDHWVTGAKYAVAPWVGTDVGQGASELVIFTDHNGDAKLVAADFLAQLEGNPGGLLVLVTTAGESFVEAVEVALGELIADHGPGDVLGGRWLGGSTLDGVGFNGATVGGDALSNLGPAGIFCVPVPDIETGISVVRHLAPGNVQVVTEDSEMVLRSIENYGYGFLGSQSTPALGRYGAGPNQITPSHGNVRFTGGLSVFNFMKLRKWAALDGGPGQNRMNLDAMAMAKMEGLEWNARAIASRSNNSTDES